MFAEHTNKVVRVPSLWPDELILMTRCTEEQIKKLLSNPLEETYTIDPVSTQASASKTIEVQSSIVKSAEHKLDSDIKGKNLVSPPQTTLKTGKAKKVANTETKPEGKNPLAKQIFKKPTPSAQVIQETDNFGNESLEQKRRSDICSNRDAPREPIATVTSGKPSPGNKNNSD